MSTRILPDYEKDFFLSSIDSYLIYQAKSETPYKFRDYNEAIEHGNTVSLVDYIAVYDGPLPTETSIIDDLNHLYKMFNYEHPKDFRGHSMSVSDIIVMRKGDKVTSHYVCGIGFQQLMDLKLPHYEQEPELPLREPVFQFEGYMVKERLPLNDNTEIMLGVDRDNVDHPYAVIVTEPRQGMKDPVTYIAAQTQSYSEAAYFYSVEIGQKAMELMKENEPKPEQQEGMKL